MLKKVLVVPWAFLCVWPEGGQPKGKLQGLCLRASNVQGQLMLKSFELPCPCWAAPCSSPPPARGLGPVNPFWSPWPLPVAPLSAQRGGASKPISDEETLQASSPS